MNEKLKNTLTYLGFTLTGIVLFYLAYIQMDWSAFWLRIDNADKLLVGASFLMGYLAIVSRGLRWLIMLEPMGYRPSAWNSISSVAFAYFANTFVPRSGEVARCTALNQTDGIPVNKLMGTVISERIVDFIMLFIFMFLGIVFNAESFITFISNAASGGNDNKFMILVGGMGVMIVGITTIYLFKNKIKTLSFYEKAAKFTFGIIEGAKSVLAMEKKGLFILHTAFIWLMYFLMAYVVLFAIGLNLGVMQGVFIVVAGGLGMVFPAPGGTGSYQLAVQFGFIALGLSGTVGLDFAWLVWGTQTVQIILTGGLGFIMITSAKVRRSKAKAIQKA